MLNTWRQRRNKPGFVWFYIKALSELNQQTTWTNLKSRHTNKSRKQFKSLTKPAKPEKANNYKSCRKQIVPQCKAWQDECSQTDITKRKLSWRKKQNPKDLGGYKFTKNTFYSHAINNNPAQKKIWFRKEEMSAALLNMVW